MNPVCTITVEGNKAVAVGTISVGEKIDVTVVGINPASIPDYGEESWFEGKSLRLRIVDTQGHDLARFPLKESDSWTVEGDRLSAVNVELNTRQLRNVFSGVAYGDKLQFGLILDSGIDHAQYARGKVNIQQWAVASIDDPTVVPDWTEILAQLDRDLAEIETSKSEAVNAAKESVEAAGASGRNALAAKESALDAASSKNDAVSAKEAAVLASSRYPRIENGRWLVWQNGAWVDNGPAQGPKGDMPSLDGVVKKEDVVPVDIPDGDTIAVIGGKEIKSPKGGGVTPADYGTVRENAAIGASHAADATPHVTEKQKADWNAKQPALTREQLDNIDAVPQKRDIANNICAKNEFGPFTHSRLPDGVTLDTDQPSWGGDEWVWSGGYEGDECNFYNYGEETEESLSIEFRSIDGLLSFSATRHIIAAKDESYVTLTGIKTSLKYALVDVGVDGILTDSAINVTSVSGVIVPDDFADLLIRASVTNALNVTMPDGVTVYGDDFPAESGEYLVTITKIKEGEAFVKSLKLEVPNA